MPERRSGAIRRISAGRLRAERCAASGQRTLPWCPCRWPRRTGSAAGSVAHVSCREHLDCRSRASRRAPGSTGRRCRPGPPRPGRPDGAVATLTPDMPVVVQEHGRAALVLAAAGADGLDVARRAARRCWPGWSRFRVVFAGSRLATEVRVQVCPFQCATLLPPTAQTLRCPRALPAVSPCRRPPVSRCARCSARSRRAREPGAPKTHTSLRLMTATLSASCAATWSMPRCCRSSAGPGTAAGHGDRPDVAGR